MSQRGSRPGLGLHRVRRNRWTFIGISLALALAFIIGTTYTLSAQDTPTQTTKTVSLRVGGDERQVKTSKDCVQTLLHQEGIELNPHDLVEPPLSTPLTDGMKITVSRVTFALVEERVAIAPPVTTRWDHRMTANPVTLRAGKPGVKLCKRAMWKKDGVVTVQWIQSERVIHWPTPAVVVRGNLPSRAGITGRRVLSMVATAYDPGPGSCGRGATGRTCIGLRAGHGVIAVDPRVIPLGSRVFVDGYGEAIAADIGRAIKGHIIDLCFSTRGEAMRWGRRTVNVVVLE